MDYSDFTRNEGVPGPSPGVGSLGLQGFPISAWVFSEGFEAPTVHVCGRAVVVQTGVGFKPRLIKIATSPVHGVGAIVPDNRPSSSSSSLTFPSRRVLEGLEHAVPAPPREVVAPRSHPRTSSADDGTSYSTEAT